ncbi:ATP-binding protein [Dialister sp.]|uniref:ATP-binding protein n=1 Tax=Dialister sp. TaxID=1955814 RepID=UPI002E80C99C|nr:ATP-binding protein [Dialister sp.]MEE3452928.1 ATP-binding protein [Dialister sp.]
MYINRHMEKEILKCTKQYPVIMVCGQRQVGKSTMLYHLREPSRTYVTLDDINARHLAESDPALFFETYEPPVLIDEFQRVPGILLEIKKIIDRKALSGEPNEGMFWLTGSQKFSMMKHISESLAGRAAVFDLSGLSTAEITGKSPWLFAPSLAALKERWKESRPVSLKEVYERIFQGGMPKVIVSDIGQERYYGDYVNTYLERDVRDYAHIGKLHEFTEFLIYMAAHTAQELKYSEIAKSIGISAPTVKEWVSILESSGIIYILRPWFSNLTIRLVKTPKVYFMDTGLAAWLCRWPTAQTLQNGAMNGAFFETYVVSEIIKSYYNAGRRPDLYYYRDVDRKEIDLLIVRGNTMFPIEIKRSSTPAHPDKNFSVLKKFNMEIEPGIILCLADNLMPLNRETWLCPVSVL